MSEGEKGANQPTVEAVADAIAGLLQANPDYHISQKELADALSRKAQPLILRALELLHKEGIVSYHDNGRVSLRSK